MDDYNITSLYESQNEWVARLVNILTPEIITGFREMLREAMKLCNTNNEDAKYLMTMQNFMSRVPKWNETMIQDETKRIIEDTGCTYLDDLISCVHIIQLKCLSCIRVSQQQKKVDIDIPNLNMFIHQVYINSARKLYKNVYLFEQGVPPLEFQRNQNMMETIIKESIVNTIRENVPVDNLLRVYLENQGSEEMVVSEEIVEERNEPATPIVTPSVLQERLKEENTDRSEESPIELEPIRLNVVLDESEVSRPTTPMSADMPNGGRLTFSNIDKALNEDNIEEEITASKDIERLEKISNQRCQERLAMEEEDDDSDLEKLHINTNESLNIETLGFVEIL